MMKLIKLLYVLANMAIKGPENSKTIQKKTLEWTLVCMMLQGPQRYLHKSVLKFLLPMWMTLHVENDKSLDVCNKMGKAIMCEQREWSRL